MIGWDFRATLTNNTKQTRSEIYYAQNKEKRKEIGKSAGYWTMLNSHKNVLKGLRYQALRFTQLTGFNCTIKQYKQMKCEFPKLIFQFLIFLCLIYVSNPRVHLQEDNCIHSYGMVHFALFSLSPLQKPDCKDSIFFFTICLFTAG